MSYSHAAAAYREREVAAASPEKLVVIVFDHMLANLRRARLALDAGNIEQRVQAIGRARDAVMELLVTTDVERGGQIAQNLRALYGFALKELMAIRRPSDGARLDKLSQIMMNLREAFATIANDAAQKPAA